jgi:hypothetical protein
MAVYQVTLYEKTVSYSTIVVEADSEQEAHDAIMAYYRSPECHALDWENYKPEFDGMEIEDAEDGDQLYRVVRGRLEEI